MVREKKSFFWEGKKNFFFLKKKKMERLREAYYVQIPVIQAALEKNGSVIEIAKQMCLHNKRFEDLELFDWEIPYKVARRLAVFLLRYPQDGTTGELTRTILRFGRLVEQAALLCIAFRQIEAGDLEAGHFNLHIVSESNPQLVAWAVGLDIEMTLCL